MEYLLSEHSQRSKEYLREAKSADCKPPIPATKLRIVMELWEEVFPHRRLDETETGKLKAYPPDAPEEDYNAAELSDGERVAFYLIGECMAAPEDGIIVVDEPEIHLHRSIQSDLWDAIEQERDDCQFIYFTHDLSFATDREATRIWLKDYDESGDEPDWTWEVIEEQQGIPEEVLLSILGSRRPVLFVEGERGSLDYRIYKHVYPEYTVVPCGGCGKVISATKAFEDLRGLHDLDCYGLIDRDYRTDGEIESLETESVHVTQVSEIENLFITEKVLRIVGQERHLDEGEEEGMDTRIRKAKNRVFENLKDEKERLAASISAHRIRRRLKRFGPDQEDKEALEECFETTVSIDIDEIYQEVEEEISSILKNRDYDEAIKIFNQEGLPFKVAPLFKEGKDYDNYVIRLLSSGHSGLRDALREHVPALPDSEEEGQSAPATDSS